MITRLPSNLRSTTRECVYLVTHGNFRSRDKDGGHTIQSAISKTPCYTQTSWLALCFVEPESFPMEVLHWGNDRGLLLWPWPWLDDLRIWTWPVLPGDISDVQIWIFYVKAFESYHLTDRKEIVRTLPCLSPLGRVRGEVVYRRTWERERVLNRSWGAGWPIPAAHIVVLWRCGGSQQIALQYLALSY